MGAEKTDKQVLVTARENAPLQGDQVTGAAFRALEKCRLLASPVLAPGASPTLLSSFQLR
jgi:hypothetical protein